jgi:hypothetical protein
MVGRKVGQRVGVGNYTLRPLRPLVTRTDTVCRPVVPTLCTAVDKISASRVGRHPDPGPRPALRNVKTKTLPHEDFDLYMLTLRPIVGRPIDIQKIRGAPQHRRLCGRGCRSDRGPVDAIEIEMTMDMVGVIYLWTTVAILVSNQSIRTACLP